ncbi:MAG: DUF3618 domain-containing protein [Propionibacteriaceae bacterium]
MADNARTKEQIQNDLIAARARLSDNIENLVNEVHPKAVKDRTIADAKAFVVTEVNNVKSQVVDENGLRYDRLVIMGGAAAGIATVVGIIRVIFGKN